jgi:hypothetical protein
VHDLLYGWNGGKADSQTLTTALGGFNTSLTQTCLTATFCRTLHCEEFLLVQYSSSTIWKCLRSSPAKSPPLSPSHPVFSYSAARGSRQLSFYKVRLSPCVHCHENVAKKRVTIDHAVKTIKVRNKTYRHVVSP